MRYEGFVSSDDDNGIGNLGARGGAGGANHLD